MKYIYLLVILIFISCGGGSERAKESDQRAPKQFEVPVIPVTIVAEEGKKEYLVAHYWDRFDFKDTTWLQTPSQIEQALVNYIDALYFVAPLSANLSIKKLVKAYAVDTSMYRLFDQLLDKYLNDPNSPMRNEEFYIPVLEATVDLAQLTELEKSRPRYQLEQARKNRPGHPATDFRYTLASGAKERMYDVKAYYTLLYFYNPGCANCQEVRDQMLASAKLKELQHNRRLQVVAIYPDEELEEWKNYKDSLPTQWINGYDQGTVIRASKLYDLRAIPTLYLLDQSKQVLLKDAQFPMIEHYLIEQNNPF